MSARKVYAPDVWPDGEGRWLMTFAPDVGGGPLGMATVFNRTGGPIAPGRPVVVVADGGGFAAVPPPALEPEAPEDEPPDAFELVASDSEDGGVGGADMADPPAEIANAGGD